MNTESWKYVALKVADAEVRFRAAEDQEADQTTYDLAAGEYRAWLLRMQARVEQALASVPRPRQPPEKAAGYLSEPWRAGA